MSNKTDNAANVVSDLLRVLQQIQNNAAARKWNSQSEDRADGDAFVDIERKCKEAIAKARGQ